MTALEIKGMKIGEGLPKTIISLMDPTVDETIETIKTGIEVGVDAFEWPTCTIPHRWQQTAN